MDVLEYERRFLLKFIALQNMISKKKKHRNEFIHVQHVSCCFHPGDFCLQSFPRFKRPVASGRVSGPGFNRILGRRRPVTVTTRSITFLIGNPNRNLYFPLESWATPNPNMIFFPFLFLKDDLYLVNLISTYLDDFLVHLPEVCRGEMDALSYCLELGV